MSFQFHISTINISNIKHTAIGIDIIKILLKHRTSDAATCSVPDASSPVSVPSSSSISLPPTSCLRSPSPESLESEVPPTKQPRLSRETDIGVFVSEKSSGASMTTLDMHRLILHHFIPNRRYEFPRSEKTGRHFMHSLLARYAWLRYSKSCNGGFCLPCVLFAKRGGFRSAPDLFVRKPLGDIDSHFVKLLSYSNSIMRETITSKL